MKRNICCVVVAIATAMVPMSAPPAYATTPGINGRIVFRVYFNRDHTQGAIFTINPDGTGIEQVTHPSNKVLTTEPDWSPDGQWIVYTAYHGGSEDRSRIFKIHPDGTGRTFLGASCSSLCLTDSFPAWSPDGQQIAFQRGLGPKVGRNKLIALFVMSADGTNVMQVTQPGATSDHNNRYQDLGSPVVADRRPPGVRALRSKERQPSGLHRGSGWLRTSPDHAVEPRRRPARLVTGRRMDRLPYARGVGDPRRHLIWSIPTARNFTGSPRARASGPRVRSLRMGRRSQRPSRLGSVPPATRTCM